MPRQTRRRSRRSPRAIGWLVATVLVVACSDVAAPPPATSTGRPDPSTRPPAATVADEAGACQPRELVRRGGRDRVATAVALSSHAWDHAATVVLAPAGRYPDALAAGALAARRGAPTLLTPRDRLPADVAAEIERLDPDAVTVVGGPAVISEQVLHEIAATAGRPDVERIAGADRYATAARLAGAAGAGPTVALASGERFADAVSAGALAAGGDPVPTLLTPSGDLHDAARDALHDLGVATVLVVGGPEAVDPSVERSLTGAGLRVERLAGEDRYATSAEVAGLAVSWLGDRLGGVVLATGSQHPDALSAAPLGARTSAVLALVPTTSLDLPRGTAELLERRRDRLACAVVVGGSAAVSVRTAEQIASSLRVDPPDGPPVLVGAGDIAVCGSTGDEATARLVADLPDATVATFGDNAYDRGTHREFAECYEPSWGRFRHRTRPSAGNHDHGTHGAAGYFDHFGAAAGPRGRGWYSYDLGPWWHVVVLDSNCSAVGGCGPGSPQERWLRDDLAAHAGRHVLAYWHAPRWSSGRHGSSRATAAFWRALYDHGADLVLAGHDHDYERLAPLGPDGTVDGAHGIRSFVVGTGGATLRAFHRPPLAATEVRQADDHGVLQLTLRRDGYDWRFRPVAGGTFTDEGSGTVHAAP